MAALALLLIVSIALIIADTLRGRAGVREPSDTPAERIGSETVMERKVHFSSCGHELSTDMDPQAYVGYTREELAAQFPHASVMEFNADRVMLMQVNTGYCPRHFILRLRSDGTLSVMQTSDRFLTEELVALITDESAHLPPAETRSLESGLPFDSLSEIDAYLESMGS